MRTKTFTDRNTGRRFNYLVANVDDFVNLKKGSVGKIKNYKSIFKVKREKEALQIAKEMFTDMMKMMAADMIEKNYAIVFPYSDFGYMVVGDKTNQIKNPKFSVESGGRAYGLKLQLSDELFAINGKFYRGRFNQVNRLKIMDLVQKGHKY